MEEIKIAFFDIDGTLASNTVRSDSIISRIPESTLKALDLLRLNGITPVAATGRGRMAVLTVMEQLGMDSYIAANGMSLTYQGKEVYRSFLPGADVEAAVGQLIGLPGVTIVLETTLGNVLCQQGYGRPIRFEIDKSGDLSDLGAFDSYQITVAGDDLKRRVQLQVPGLKARMVAPGISNIFFENTSKASGIKQLLTILGMNRSQAIAFGDEENDLEMFEAVGVSVAMGNGMDSLKKRATYVTSHVDEDGIWRACEHFGLI